MIMYLMDMVLMFDILVVVMKVNGKMDYLMVKVKFIIKVVNITKEIFLKEEDKVMVFINVRIIPMKVNGLMVKWKVVEN